MGKSQKNLKIAKNLEKNLKITIKFWVFSCYMISRIDLAIEFVFSPALNVLKFCFVIFGLWSTGPVLNFLNEIA